MRRTRMSKGKESQVKSEIGPRPIRSEKERRPMGISPKPDFPRKSPTTLIKKKSTTRTRPDSGRDTSDKGNSAKKRNGAKVGNYNRDKPSTPEQKANFVTFLNQTFETGVQGILAQYNAQLRGYVPQNITRQAFDQNGDKNRYRDVVCGDNSRVVLSDGPQPYIHANYLHGEPLVNKFICTQGPMPNTVIDFWRMVVQERVENIFMLCETIEQDKPKCEQYWPREKDKTMEFGGISVRNIEVDTSDSTTILCSLELKTSTEKLSVKHYQWRTWPDKAVPQSVMAPFRLLKISRWAPCSIIHCSAGIGRTGTVAVLELCLQILLTCQPLNVVQTIQFARTMRLGAVQTDLQVLYIHKCLIAYATAAGLVEGNIKERAIKFELDYNDLMRTHADPDIYEPIQPVKGFGSPALLTPQKSPK